MSKADSRLEGDRLSMDDDLEEENQFQEIRPLIHIQLASHIPHSDAQRAGCGRHQGKLTGKHQYGVSHRMEDH